MSLFTLRGKLSSQQSILLGFVGFILFLLVWWLLAEAFAIEKEPGSTTTEFIEEAAPTTSETAGKIVDADPQTNGIAEGSPLGAKTGLKALLQDVPTSTSYLFRIANNTSPFAIHPLEGTITLRDSVMLDHERVSNYLLEVEAQLEEGAVVRQSFSVPVFDANEFKIGTVEEIDPRPNEVSIQAAEGSSTGVQFFAEDADGQDQVNYRLTQNPAAAFGLSLEAELLVKDPSSLQGLGAGSQTVEVEAQSTDGSTSRQTVTLQIVDSPTAGIEQASGGEKVYPILPTPGLVVQSYPSLWGEDDLWGNTLQSIWLNVQGYLWAVLISVPIGFLIGLIPLFRGLFNNQVNALRYLPLTALTGLFIIWFGIEDAMKIAFLAFGIIVYLLPVVVQRIDEVKDVYTKTVFTLGANNWQTIRTVYIPSVMSKLIDDIRVLTAISWTYIIIAELLNRQGGIGALIYIKARQGQISKVFATLIVIVAIGFIQDRIFVYLDRRLFPFKYQKTILTGTREVEYGIATILGLMILVILLGAFIPTLGSTLISVVWVIAITALLLIAYGEVRMRSANQEA